MPVTYDTVRACALALPGVEEGLAYGTPSLHVGRKLLGRLREDGETLVLKVDPVDRTRLFEGLPDTFYTTDHYRDHPVMLVNLPGLDAQTLPGLIAAAWRCVAPKRLLAASTKPPAR